MIFQTTLPAPDATVSTTKNIMFMAAMIADASAADVKHKGTKAQRKAAIKRII
ncbi:MAG TPA: hypothetical protein VE422_24050 [Terriglobia bacterium]|nr:hypothetical protein [Terriglobia bacterium]